MGSYPSVEQIDGKALLCLLFWRDSPPLRGFYQQIRAPFLPALAVPHVGGSGPVTLLLGMMEASKKASKANQI